jgi:hypothetical protein
VGQQFEFFEIEELEVASAKGRKLWSKFGEIGLEADAGNLEGLEETEGPGVRANNAELPGDSCKVKYEVVGEVLVAVICESEDNGTLRSEKGIKRPG